MSIPKQLHRRRLASNIPRYFVYTAIKGFGFGLFAAIWVIYLQERRGLSLAQAALIDVTFFVAAALGAKGSRPALKRLHDTKAHFANSISSGTESDDKRDHVFLCS